VSSDSNEKFDRFLLVYLLTSAGAAACMADESATITAAKDIRRRRLLQVAALFA